MTTCTKCGTPVEIGDFPLCRGNPEDHKGGAGSICVGNAARIDTVVYFRNARGEVHIPGRNDVPTPPGYERHETTQPHEVRSLMKSLDTESRIKHELAAEREERELSEARKARRSDLRQRMQSMSNHGRDFARHAMAMNDNRAKPRYAPGNHMVALEYNDSNHDAAIPKEKPRAVPPKEVLAGVGADPDRRGASGG